MVRFQFCFMFFVHCSFSKSGFCIFCSFQANNLLHIIIQFNFIIDLSLCFMSVKKVSGKCQEKVSFS